MDVTSFGLEPRLIFDWLIIVGDFTIHVDDPPENETLNILTESARGGAHAQQTLG